MSDFIRRVKNEYLPAFLCSVIIGIIVGVVVGLFNMVLSLLTKTSVSIYEFIQGKWLFIVIFFMVLIGLALFMSFIHKHNPQVRGGGMPQTIAMCKGDVKYNWWQVLWSNIVCSCISFFAGLPVGAEGPSMFVGASCADGAWKKCQFRPYMRKYLISAGASSGFAATFNAPLAGIIFTIEKVHRKFSPLLLYVVSIAVICSTLTINLINYSMYGDKVDSYFNFGQLLTDIPFDYLGMIAILGVIIGICSVIFQILLIESQKFFDKKIKQIPYWFRLICAFVLTGIIGIFIIDAVTSGHDVIEKVISLDFAVLTIGIILLLRLFLIVVCYNSGATGGLFVPTLCVGALIGGLCGHLFMLLGMPTELYATIVCFSMLAFLTGTTHAPISSLVLLLEITGFSGKLLSAGIAIIIAFIVSVILERKSLFEEQVDRLIAQSGYKENDDTISKSFIIGDNSVLVNKRVSDVFLLKSINISLIIRDDKKIVADSETRFKVGDKVQFVYQKANISEIEEYLRDITQ